MSNRHQAKLKVSRRLEVHLWGSEKDPYLTKNYPPGQHGPAGKRKISDYGKQLRAKQQLKFYYGDINEKSFRNIYKRASRMRGDTGENLIGLLERRLATVLYRANFVASMFAARQLVNHKHVTVNGKSVNIASYRVKAGDIIQLKPKSRQLTVVLESIQKQAREIPDYLEVNAQEGTIKFNRIPQLADVPFPVVMEPNLVVEFYSR